MRVLVIGGTGGFGTTICRLLLRDGRRVVAASRTPVRAMSLGGVGHVTLDRNAVRAANLAGFDLVVDASGPFQNQEPVVALAAIAAGVDYLDISDDREFALRVTALDAEAKRVGVALVTGASSIPGLSSAAAIETSAGMERVDRVDVSISASSRAVLGRSVLAAMLRGAGRRLPSRHGPDRVAMLTSRRIVASSPNGDLRRTVLACDAPDAAFLPAMLPGDPEVRFHAGSELTIHNAGMRAVAAAVGMRLLATGSPASALADLARRMTSGRGDGRSAMLVEVRGRVGGRAMLRRWSLIAERDAGPSIPCLVVPALADRIDRGDVTPGARSACGMLGVDAILHRMPASERTIVVEESIDDPLYRRAMGAAWDRLDPEVRAMHDANAGGVALGRADVVHGRSAPAALIRRAFRFPAAGADVPVSVTFDVEDGVETWTRVFGGRTFSSSLRLRPGGVEERFGPMRFRFLLCEENGAILMRPDGWSIMGLPMPRRLQPDGTAREKGRDGRFHFHVPIRVPGIGDVVTYQGWLDRIGPRIGGEGKAAWPVDAGRLASMGDSYPGSTV